MSRRNEQVLDPAVAKTNEWLAALEKKLDSGDRHFAYIALRATLHALRDRLTTDETAQLAAQLPLVVRGMYYEGWDPQVKRPREHKAACLEEVANDIRGRLDIDVERVVRAVFELIAERVTGGEIEDVRLMLPWDLRELWPGLPAEGERISASGSG